MARLVRLIPSVAPGTLGGHGLLTTPTAVKRSGIFRAQASVAGPPPDTPKTAKHSSPSASANSLIAPGSETRQELKKALSELAEAARSLRLLADQLERQPESLIRGREARR